MFHPRKSTAFLGAIQFPKTTPLGLVHPMARPSLGPRLLCTPVRPLMGLGRRYYGPSPSTDPDCHHVRWSVRCLAKSLPAARFESRIPDQSGTIALSATLRTPSYQPSASPLWTESLPSTSPAARACRLPISPASRWKL